MRPSTSRMGRGLNVRCSLQQGKGWFILDVRVAIFFSTGSHSKLCLTLTRSRRKGSSWSKFSGRLGRRNADSWSLHRDCVLMWVLWHWMFWKSFIHNLILLLSWIALDFIFWSKIKLAVVQNIFWTFKGLGCLCPVRDAAVPGWPRDQPQGESPNWCYRNAGWAWKHVHISLCQGSLLPPNLRDLKPDHIEYYLNGPDVSFVWHRFNFGETLLAGCAWQPGEEKDRLEGFSNCSLLSFSP